MSLDLSDNGYSFFKNAGTYDPRAPLPSEIKHVKGRQKQVKYCQLNWPLQPYTGPGGSRPVPRRCSSALELKGSDTTENRGSVSDVSATQATYLSQAGRSTLLSAYHTGLSMNSAYARGIWRAAHRGNEIFEGGHQQKHFGRDEYLDRWLAPKRPMASLASNLKPQDSRSHLSNCKPQSAK